MKSYFASVIYLTFLFVACDEGKHKRRMDNIELSNGVTIKCKALSKIEYGTLMKDTLGTSIPSFKELYNIEVHQLKNREILVKEEDYFTLYYSLDDLEKVLLHRTGGSGSQSFEILLNKNPYGKAFPNETDDLIKRLITSLGIEYKEPNEGLLREIDAKINKLEDPTLFRKEHLLSFVAVIGEAFKRKHCAEWVMQLASDGVTWNPYLEVRGQKIELITYLYEDIFIRDDKEEFLLFEIYETINAIEKFNLEK